jgi:hypothetical protein
MEAIYLVTARHVALALGDDPFSIRINRVDDASDTFHCDPLDPKIPDWFKWFTPEDPLVDLAIMPFNIDFTRLGFDVRALSGSEWLLDDAKWAEEKIGPGDLCYAIGLFKLVQGSKRNVPIVHTGRIALNSGEELIPIDDWNNPAKTAYVHGHLVELTNLEGLSGAPVIVRAEVLLHGFIEEPKALVTTDSTLHLLGVWQGSWNHKIHDGRRPLAMGVVTPASELLKLLQQHDVTVERGRFYAAILQENAAKPDVAEATPSSPVKET